MVHISLPTELVVPGAAVVTSVAAANLVRAISARLFAYLGLRLRLRTAVQLAEAHPGIRIEITEDEVVVVSPAPTVLAEPAASLPTGVTEPRSPPARDLDDD